MLSAAQRALWSSQLRHPDAPLQNMALVTHIDGPVDADRLATAFHRVVAASDTLRLTIGRQVGIAPDPPAASDIIELERSEVSSWARDRVLSPIDVSECVYDSVILPHPDGTVSWYLALHHVATDATSSALVFEATVAAYDGRPFALETTLGRNRVQPEPDPDARTEAEERAAKRRQRSLDFWAGRSPAPLLDSLYRPIAERTTEAHRLPVVLGTPGDVEAALSGPYRMISNDLAWTTFLMTALAVHLHRISGADRFAIGLPVHHRSRKDQHRIVGPLMEVYPVDIEIAADATHASLHRSISKSIMQVVGNAVPSAGVGAADVSGIVNVIPRGSIGSFGDLATSTSWVHPGAADPNHLVGLQLTTYDSEQPSLFVDINAGGADATHRRRAAEHIVAIVDAMVADPDGAITDRPMVTRDEQLELEQWGSGRALDANRFSFDPKQPRSTGSVVDRLSVALRNSSRTALIDGDVALTGHDLWQRAEEVAASLTEAGVGRGRRVGIELSRSADAVVAIIGVLLAGASYVPIDPSHPEARRVRTGERAGVVGVLTDLDGFGRDSASVQIPELDPADEAYVLFTSGSTGEPKGVPISHGGLADYLAFAAEIYLGPKQRRPIAPLFTALGFDLTVTSLFLPLIGGGTVVVIAEDGVPGLERVASRTDLTWIKATPSHLELLARMFSPRHRISTIVVGGEAFPTRLAAELSEGRPGIEIANEYGPTEAVVGCMLHRWLPGRASHADGEAPVDVPIGRPAPGVMLRIVDAHGHDVPIGAAGQLMISSPGLSTGYLGQEPNTGPFTQDEGRRWYASGDIVRLDAEHSAVYLGRVDDQIKLNGVRLEPGEVVAAIEEHPSVRRAAVRLWVPATEGGTSARPVLAAWVEAEADLDASDLRLFLLPRLALHQIPTAFAFVAEFAFNTNGKLDLDDVVPQRVRGSGRSSADVDSVVADAVRVAWAQALALSDGDGGLKADDDFFVLGGDSLAALEMTASLSVAVDREVPEGLVFSASGFGDFVAVVTSLETSPHAGGPTSIPGPPEASPGEAAMLFEHFVDPDSSRYNIGRRYVIDEAIEPDRLESAAAIVVERHQPLHTTHGRQRRTLGADDALHFSVAGLDGAEGLTDDVSRVAARALYEAPFDLDNGPLVRVAVHRLLDERTAVVVVMHHISGDAGSLDRFWSDLSRAYDGEGLEPLAFTYADHAAWQRTRDVGADFWSDLWSDPVTVDLGLVAPVAGPDLVSDGYLERRASFTASALRSGPGRTPTATALGALVALLDRHHRPADDERPARYGIGLTASVREHASAEPMVGYFLNTLPMVVEVPRTGASLADLAWVASDVLGRALPHRSHPYAEMVSAARRSGRQLPYPEVLLAVEDLAPAALGGRTVDHEILASGHAVAAATVFVQIRGERVDLGIEYAGTALTAERAMLLLDDLDHLLASELDASSTGGSRLPSETRSVLTGGPVPSSTPLTAEIGKLLARPPDRPAVRCGEAMLDWTELARRSSQVAELLRINGVGPGDRVLLSLGRSVDLVIGLVAILRLGAVYVPVDPAYPSDRRERIAEAAKPIAAIVEPGAVSAWLPTVSVPRSADQHGGSDAIASLSVLGPDAEPTPEDAAYVIFTSGSTGAPKGVLVTHGQLATSTRARSGVYPQPPERFLLLSSIGFDSSIVGLFWTLSSGGEIVIPTENEVHDPDALLSLIDRSRATNVLMVPSLYRALLGRGADLEHWPVTVTVAGEACPSDLVERHHELRPQSLLVNEYGPTEATVWATSHRCVMAERPVPIGRPIDGAWCAVVDGDGDPVPAGAVGELMIGGAGVVDGYLEASAAAGEDQRFATTSLLGPGRTYRTGDAVAATTDAGGRPTLLFVGRVDEQLNVGGVRLEPGEVERVIVAVDGVDAAAVVAGTTEADADREILVAHVASTSGNLEIERLRAAMADALPLAARPSRFVLHETLPTTIHGKVDRTALSAVKLPALAPATAEGVVGPVTEIQVAVLELFSRHLGTTVGLDTGFFDAGGDSLAALTLALDLEERFDAPFSVTSLLAEPTARAVAAWLEVDGVDKVDPDLVEWIRIGDPTLPVLVLLAPGSGHLLGYQALIAALDPAIGLLGVRLPGYDGKATPIDRVGALADAVGPLIDHALDSRPAVLLGGSSGGLLAWELQHRAELAADRYLRVILQDTVHPDWRRLDDATGLVEDLRRRLSDDGPLPVLAELYGRGHRRFARWQRLRRSQTITSKGGAELPEVVAQRMFAAANRMVAEYRPSTIHAEVLFLAATNTDPDATFERWRSATPNLRLAVFEGDHFGENGITAARNVGPVASTIEAEVRSLV